MRLQKYLAHAGVASRRACEQYILDGRISINGEVVTELGTKVSEGDEVYCDGKPVGEQEPLVYYVLNKPTGYITSAKDDKNRKTVLDIMSTVKERIFPVGRLDYNTSGLLILTNDGELTYQLTHPKHNVDKTYIVKVKGKVAEISVNRLRKGVVIDERMTAPAKVDVIFSDSRTTRLKLTIHEGRNRQIRKMCEAVGHDVITLRRVAIGTLEARDLKEGQFRKLTKEEINYLRKLGQ